MTFDRPGTAARLLLVALLAVLPLLPPEVRGESLAASAALLALLVLVAPTAGGDVLGGLFLGAAGLAAGVATCWPLSSLEAAAMGLLAAAAGSAAARLPEEARGSPWIPVTVAVTGGIVGAHAAFQKLHGLRTLAARIEAGVPVADREAVLTRLSEGRAFAGFSTPAAMAGFLAMALAVTVGLAASRRGWRRAALAIACGIQVAGILSAESATASAGLAASAVLLALRRGKARKTVAALAAAAVLVVLAVAVARGGEVLSASDPESPWRLRAGNFRAAASMAADHPWVGVGPGGFGSALPAYLRTGDGETRFAHDLPLHLAAEIGLPSGAVVSALFFFLFLGPVWARPGAGEEPWRTGARVALGAFAIQNLGDFTALLPSTLWFAALLRGVLSGGRPSEGREADGEARGVGRAVLLAAAVASAAILAAAGPAWNARYRAREAVARGDLAEALKETDRAVALAPWNPDSAAARAEALLASAPGDGDAGVGEALREADRAVSLAPTRPGIRVLRATARIRSGDLPGAFADVSEAARLYPRSEDHRRLREELARRLPAAGKSEVPP